MFGSCGAVSEVVGASVERAGAAITPDVMGAVDDIPAYNRHMIEPFGRALEQGRRAA
jgi:hypothetical protein